MPESFYGGAPGVPFIIVTNFASVEDMVAAFQQGPSYTEVHFDEHVLINTENKNEDINGQIYRRGYDYTNDMGGAVYVGTIVGPSGPAPHVELTTVEDVKNKFNEASNQDTRYGEGSYAPKDNLIPGKTKSGYNDEIQWAYCSIRDENGIDTTAWIGFIIPTMVIEFEASSVDPYYNRSNQTDNFTNLELVEQMESEDGELHPFWEKWHIDIPKGIKGDTFENFRVIVASANDGVESYNGQEDDRANNREILVYDYYHFDKEENGEPVTIYLGDYNMITGIAILDDGTITIEYSHDDNTQYTNLFKWIKEITLDTTNGHFTIIYNYDIDENGNPTKYEVDLAWVSAITMTHEGKVTIHYITGDQENLDEIIQWVDAVTLDEDGTLEIQFNTGEKITWNSVLKWITNVELTDNGDFKIEFNNGDDMYTTHLTWVNDIVFEINGTISVHYNDGTDDFTYKNLIKWITNIELTDNGDFKIEFNNGDDAYTTHLTWVNDIIFNENGTVEIHYNDGTDDFTYKNLIKWITGVSLTEDGIFTIDFNNGDSSYTTSLSWIHNITIDDDGTIHIVDNQGEENLYDQYLKIINNIDINVGDPEGSENQKIHVVYNTGEEEDIGAPLNYIMRMELMDSDYHLLVLYSDPEKRQEIINTGQNYTFDGRDDWLDLGSVKDDSGIFIGLNYEGFSLPERITDDWISSVITALNQDYPEGLGINSDGSIDLDLHGKVVTIGDDEFTYKACFAYDYDKNTWYYVGNIGESVLLSDIIYFGIEQEEPESLRAHGAWLVLEDWNF